MKTIIAIMLLVSTLAGIAYAFCNTDMSCVMSCISRGGDRNYCYEICTGCQ